MRRARRRVPIAARFWLVLAVLVIAMSVMAKFSFDGLSRISDSAGGLHTAVSQTVVDNRTRAEIDVLRSGLELYIAADSAALVKEVRAEVEGGFARLEVQLAEMGRRYARHPAELELTFEQQRRLQRLLSVWRAGGFDVRGRARDAQEGALVRRVRDLLRPMFDASDALAARDRTLDVSASAQARRSYTKTRDVMAAVFTATMVLGVGMFLWLIRTVVPRTRRYSSFAAQVSSGRLGDRLEPRGVDELGDLGRSLNDMVARHEGELEYQRSQGQFVDAMQVSETEDEAHEMIKRHLERSIPASTVVVLNRNNSDDRLEARSAVEAGSALAEALDGARPRSCLAVRFGRRNEDGGDRSPLLSCEICGKLPELSTCNPLLVGGEVIGSVLLTHAAELGPRDDVRIRDSVSQAAPVLANLRNLSIAELRAATDALTGLPNNRAVQDTVRRMVAQALRAQSPLAVALLDLDRFKQINDTYGHGRGDEVLATVAEAMRGAVRESDFVGRYGGEEFVILLPDTDLAGARVVAENVRLAVAQLSLATVDRAITASIGVAVLPEDGSDSDTLVRNADRALYAAKSNGRNRVETAGCVPADPAATAIAAPAAG
jgi:diguanylate cyclase (GGDEF)-like protein